MESFNSLIKCLQVIFHRSLILRQVEEYLRPEVGDMDFRQQKPGIRRHPVRYVYEVARQNAFLESGNRYPEIPLGHVVRIEVADRGIALLSAFAFVEHHLLTVVELRRVLIAVNSTGMRILWVLNSHIPSSKSSFPWHGYAVRPEHSGSLHTAHR